MNDIFITENFLLQNDRAVELYHQFARSLPIIDYHCHLPPRLIAEDHRFANLAEIWLYGDHYKWRAMRSAGVPERFCTGDAGDWEKFEKWAEVVPKTLRNPLYHWTHMELKRPLGISDRLLNPQTARGIWDQCNAMLARDDMSARGIMRQMKVVLVCTTDDPVDTLECHAAIAADAAMKIRVLPTFRPDRALAIDVPEIFNHYVDRLAEVSDVDVGDAFPCFLDALRNRHDFFHRAGCRLSDHGLETVEAVEGTSREATGIFARVRRGNRPSPDEISRFRSAMLYEMAIWDHNRGWTQQFHIGALRNNNSRMFQQVGADTGFDSIADGGMRPRAIPLPRPARPHEPVGTNDPLQPQSRVQRRPGNDDRQFSGRQRARQDTVRQRLVVPRSEGRHRAADQLPLEPWAAERLCRHVDRQPVVPFVHAARVLPPHPLQSIGQ